MPGTGYYRMGCDKPTHRAGGAVTSCSVEGESMVIGAKLGKYPVNFGAASGDIGGQALEAVEVHGSEVITSWAGFAGAGVGIAACLPQAPGVIRAEYPSEDDLNVGGARTNRVRIVSPKYEKICIGIDDTDTKTEGATWVMALKCAEACHIEGVEFLNMRLVQLNPAVPYKTSNCVSSALNFAVKTEKVPALLEFVLSFVASHTVSPDTGIAYYRGIGFSAESPALALVKNTIMTLSEAEKAAMDASIVFIDGNARKGRIGALGVCCGVTGVLRRRDFMVNISDPYVIHYPRIVAVADPLGNNVELVEFFDCVGGAMWTKCHYAQSPLVKSVRCVGSTMRYSLKTGSVDLALEGSRFPAGISSCLVDKSEIAVTYVGMGGGGVGVAACRSNADGVLREPE